MNVQAANTIAGEVSGAVSARLIFEGSACRVIVTCAVIIKLWSFVTPVLCRRPKRPHQMYCDSVKVSSADRRYRIRLRASLATFTGTRLVATACGGYRCLAKTGTFLCCSLASWNAAL